MNLNGEDGDGQVIPDPDEFWQQVKGPDGSYEQWYSKSVQYWDQQEASTNGVLGGYGHVSDVDIRDSKALLKKAFAKQLAEGVDNNRHLIALDCGAGVGRVTEHLLIHHFHEVDLLEPSQHLLQTAEKQLTGAKLPKGHRLGKLMCIGLQQLDPDPQRYDCIWVQWCLLYLTDGDTVALFERCKHGLKPDGIMVVKENICKDGFVVDHDDSSLTRSNAYLLQLFERAGMQVLYNIKQRNFPKQLYEVRMYALRPRGPAGTAAPAPAPTADVQQGDAAMQS